MFVRWSVVNWSILPAQVEDIVEGDFPIVLAEIYCLKTFINQSEATVVDCPGSRAGSMNLLRILIGSSAFLLCGVSV